MQIVVTYHVEGDDVTRASSIIAGVVEHVLLAERLGFDSVWLAEHHFGSHRSVMPAPFVLAAYLAGKTERLRVGTSVVCLPLHRPVTVAESAAVLDVMSGGRLDLGFGTGSAPVDFQVFGVAQEERHRRFEEGLQLLRRLFAGEAVAFSGSGGDPVEVCLRPLPLQRWEEMVWVAASSEATAALAGKWGAGLQLPRGRPAIAYVPLIAAYRQAFRETSPEREPRISIARCLLVGKTDEDAWSAVEEATRRFAQRWHPALDAAGLSMAALVRTLQFIVGSPETVREEVRRLEEVTGLTHLSLQPMWENVLPEVAAQSLVLFAEQVLPYLTVGRGALSPAR